MNRAELRLRSLTHAAALRTSGVPAGWDLRRDTARHAIVSAAMHGVRAGRRPDPEALIRLAVGTICRRWMPAPDQGCYREAWRWLSKPVTTLTEDDLVDAIALAQTWSRLTAEQQQTFEVVADHHGSVSSAAAALGVSRNEMARRYSSARRRFHQLWRMS